MRLDFASPEVFLPVVFILPAVVNNFFNLQVNPLILLFVSLGIHYARRDRTWLAGIMMGLAASLKAIPGLFLVYYMLRGQWSLAGRTAMMLALFTLSPALIYGLDGYIELLGRWLSMSLSEPLIVDSFKCTNQSLYAMWQYYLVDKLGIAEAASLEVHLAAKTSILVLFVTSMAIISRRSYEKDSPLALIECASVCVLMVLFSPIAWRHYWVYVYPASAVVYSLARVHPDVWKRRRVKYLMVAWVALVIVPYVSGSELYRTLRSYGTLTLSAITLNSLLLVLHSYLATGLRGKGRDA